MENTEKKVTEFANSIRGLLIISQALTYAIKLLEKVPSPHREISNIADMKYLRDMHFSMYKAIPDETIQQTLELAGIIPEKELDKLDKDVNELKKRALSSQKSMKKFERIQADLTNMSLFLDEKLADLRYANILLQESGKCINDLLDNKTLPKGFEESLVEKISRHIKKEEINNDKE